MAASAFLNALHADGPAADREGKMDLYGWLIGSWELDVTRYLDDGSQLRISGEWHFGWVLEGRAIQDVWIVPPRYGTPPRPTIRDRRLAHPMDRARFAILLDDDRTQAG